MSKTEEEFREAFAGMAKAFAAIGAVLRGPAVRRTRIFSARIVGNGFGRRAVTRAMMRERLRQADAYDRAWVDSHIKSASDIRREDTAAYRMFDSLPPSAEVVGPWDSGPIRDILDKQ